MDFDQYLAQSYELVQHGSPPHMLQACQEEVSVLCTRFAKSVDIDEITVGVVSGAVWSGQRLVFNKLRVLNLSSTPTYPNLRQLATWRVAHSMSPVKDSVEEVAAWVLHHLRLPPHPVTDLLPPTRQSIHNLTNP